MIIVVTRNMVFEILTLRLVAISVFMYLAMSVSHNSVILFHQIAGHFPCD